MSLVNDKKVSSVGLRQFHPMECSFTRRDHSVFEGKQLEQCSVCNFKIVRFVISVFYWCVLSLQYFSVNQ